MLIAQMNLKTPGKSIRVSPFLLKILIFSTLPLTLRENKALTCPLFLYLYLQERHAAKMNLLLALLLFVDQNHNAE